MLIAKFGKIGKWRYSLCPVIDLSRDYVKSCIELVTMISNGFNSK